jgi:hypothetical protein
LPSYLCEEPVKVGFKPHAEEGRAERAPLLCALDRQEVRPRGADGQRRSWP